MNRVAVLFLFFSHVGLASADDFLTVAVRDSNTGKPITSAVVQVHYQGIWITGYTSWEGEAWFTGIRDNDKFEVVLDAPGYEQTVKKEVAFSQITPILNVRLERAGASLARRSPAPPSVAKRSQKQGEVVAVAGSKQPVDKDVGFSAPTPSLDEPAEQSEVAEARRAPPPPSLTARLRSQRFWQTFYPTQIKICDRNGNW